jgi:hypothetical protein
LTADEKEKYDGRNITKYEYKDGDNAVTEYVEKIDNANSIRKKIIKDSNGNVVETSTERIADDMLSEKTITKKIVDKNGKEKAITTTERYSDAVKGKTKLLNCLCRILEKELIQDIIKVSLTDISGYPEPRYKEVVWD